MPRTLKMTVTLTLICDAPGCWTSHVETIEADEKFVGEPTWHAYRLAAERGWVIGTENNVVWCPEHRRPS